MTLLFHYMYVCYLQTAPGRLTCSRGEASISVVQSTETPLEANPPTQSSSSAEAQTTGALTSTTGNYIEHT